AAVDRRQRRARRRRTSGLGERTARFGRQRVARIVVACVGAFRRAQVVVLRPILAQRLLAYRLRARRIEARILPPRRRRFGTRLIARFGGLGTALARVHVTGDLPRRLVGKIGRGLGKLDVLRERAREQV